MKTNLNIKLFLTFCVYGIIALFPLKGNAQVLDGTPVSFCYKIYLTKYPQYHAVNRTDCVFKEGEDPKDWKFTSPAEGVTFITTVAYGDKITVSWTRHPSPNAKYVLEVFAPNADGDVGTLYYCTDMGSSTSAEITKCHTTDLGALTVRVIAYTEKTYDTEGHVMEDMKIYLCERRGVIVHIPLVILPPVVTPQIVCGKGPHTISVPPPPTGSENINVAWYDNIEANQDAYVHTGYSWTREFNDPLTTLYVAYFKETGCGRVYGIKTSYIIARTPPLPILSPVPQEDIVYCSTQQTITAAPSPTGDLDINVAWYTSYNDNSTAPVHTGYSWTRDFPNTAVTLWMSYFKNDPCNGVIYSSKSPFTVLKYNYIAPPENQSVTNTQGPNYYTLYVPPSVEDEDLQVKWYDMSGNLLYTGNSYYVYLPDGPNQFHITYYDEGCNVESVQSLYEVVILQGYPLPHGPCDPLFSLAATSCEKITASPGNTYLLGGNILEENLPLGNWKYVWTPSQGLSNPNIAHPIIAYDAIPFGSNQEIIYKVKVINETTNVTLRTACSALYKCNEIFARQTDNKSESTTGALRVNLINYSMELNNPVTDDLVIRYNLGDKPCDLIIRDMLGRIILQSHLSVNESIKHLSISNLEVGMYDAAMVVDGIIVDNKKFIIAK